MSNSSLSIRSGYNNMGYVNRKICRSHSACDTLLPTYSHYSSQLLNIEQLPPANTMIRNTSLYACECVCVLLAVIHHLNILIPRLKYTGDRNRDMMQTHIHQSRMVSFKRAFQQISVRLSRIRIKGSASIFRIILGMCMILPLIPNPISEDELHCQTLPIKKSGTIRSLS